MNSARTAAWGLTLFVLLVGIIGWATTGEPFFAVFIVLGAVTAVGAAVALRTPAGPTTPPTPSASSPEETP